MKVGLPGVGIGGVFYLGLVAWMPFRELWLTLRGRSSARRWRRVGLQTALAGAILAGLWAEWWLLVRLPDLLAEAWALAGPGQPPTLASPGATTAGSPSVRLEHADPVVGSLAPAIGLEHVAPVVAAAPFVIIGVILLALQLLRLATRAAPASSRIHASAGPIAAADQAGPGAEAGGLDHARSAGLTAAE